MIDRKLAKRIKLVGFDVDGVLTDGGIYLGAVDSGSEREPRRLEFKRYDIQDGIGIRLVADCGIRIAIITGRVSESVRLRAKELGVDDLAQDPDGFKITAFRKIIAKHRIDPAECAFVGDDFPDVPLLRVVGLPVCVGNAVPEVQGLCSVRLTKQGGHGAVREFCELLLEARGEWDAAWNRYVDERSQPSPPTG
jgi:3-deoxy-D-manno-octulosonate 8-phosphate phosphatase (KDO 8-P phosphatase)